MVINWYQVMFKSARIKLTLWYLLSIMTISLIFSGVIYHLIVREVVRFDNLQRNRIERNMQMKMNPALRRTLKQVSPQPVPQSDLVGEVKQRIFVGILLINSAIFIAALGLGYFLAGRTLSPIQQMVEDQQRFISDASHELKTPIASLKAAFEIYLREKSHTKKDMDLLVRESLVETNRLRYLTESLLQLIRFGSQQGHGHFALFEMGHLVQKAVDSIQSSARLKNIVIRTTLNTHMVYGDEESLKKLTLILLDNAVKYTPSGGEIEISLHGSDKSVNLSVSDTGIGIAEKDTGRIFDRFYRADSARHRDGGEGGYGLGLAIAKEIVSAHKGTIKVQSKPNKGTKIMVTLPC